MLAEKLPQHLKPEPAEIGPTIAQLPRVAAIYDGVEHGRRPGWTIKDRSEITRAIRSAKAKGLDGLGVLAHFDEFYPQADVEAFLAERRRNKRWIKAGSLAILATGIFMHTGNQPVSTEHAVVPNSIQAEVIEPQLETTTTSTPATTTTSVDASSSASITVPAAPESAPTSPAFAHTLTTSSSATTIRVMPEQFDQRHFGPVSSILVDEAFSLEVKQIGSNTRDVDVNNKTELYKYVDTLADFNGIDKDKVKAGQRISYHDCPANGAVIMTGDTVGTFAARHGLSEQQVHEMNNGNLQTIAGWCGRIAV